MDTIPELTPADEFADRLIEASRAFREMVESTKAARMSAQQSGYPSRNQFKRVSALQRRLRDELGWLRNSAQRAIEGK